MATKEMAPDQIAALVDRKIRTAVGIDSSKLQKERERVLKYYDGTLPAPQHSGQSTYVSNDVYDSVEALKADLLETFGGGQDIVKFSPQNAKDVEPCRIATEYVSYIVYRKNPGYFIFHDVIDDGLKARIGVVKVYWHSEKEFQEETFDGLDEETVQGLVAQDDIDELEAEHQGDGTFAGKLSRIAADRSHVRIDPVAPEEFFAEPQASNSARLDEYFHGQRTLLTKTEMQEQGFDVSKLKGLTPDGDDKVDGDIEKDARFAKIDSGSISADSTSNEEDRPFIVYECYVRFTKVKGDKARLYKVVMVQKTVLLCEEVSRSPFKVFVPLRSAHNFWGNSFAAKVIPTQNARTVLTRGILDHTTMTNNPRYTVLQGGLTNPREMLDNRLGGIVNISRPDAVAPLMQSPLNPFVFNTLEMLKANKEETTGTSSLAQGLNKDAISTQNSQGMIQDLVTLSKQRAKVVARNFAQFLADVYIEAYTLTIENDDKQSAFEVAGNWVDIDPRTWIERKDAQITFHLGQNAADAEALRFAGMFERAAGNPALARAIGEKGAYNAAVHTMRLMGVKNTADFITDPQTLPPPQPSPQEQMEMKKLELETKKIEADLQKAATEAQLRIKEMELEMARMEHERATLGIETQLKIAESHRKDMQVANEIDVAQRELDIAEAAPSIEPAKAIVSANS
jgi:hypothetical protein